MRELSPQEWEEIMALIDHEGWGYILTQDIHLIDGSELEPYINDLKDAYELLMDKADEISYRTGVFTWRTF